MVTAAACFNFEGFRRERGGWGGGVECLFNAITGRGRPWEGVLYACVMVE